MAFSMERATVVRKNKNKIIRKITATIKGDTRLTDNIKDALILLLVDWGNFNGDNVTEGLNEIIGDFNILLSYCCDKRVVLISKVDVERNEAAILSYIECAAGVGGFRDMVEELNSSNSIDFSAYIQNIKDTYKDKIDMYKNKRERIPISYEDKKKFLEDVGGGDK